MTIAQRIYGLILIAFLGLAGLTGLAIWQTGRVFEAANFSTINVVPSLIDLDIAGRAFNQARVDTFKIIDATDATVRSRFIESLNNDQNTIKQELDDYEKNNIADDKDRGMLKEDREAIDAYFVLSAQTRSMVNDGKIDDARALIFTKEEIVARATKAIDTHNNYNVELGTKAASEAASTFSSSKMQEGLIAIVVISVVLGMGILTARRITKPLVEAVTIAETVASGDLTARIEIASKDEIGKLLQALKTMNDNLVKIVGQVRTGTDAITIASGEISQGNMDLSARTESQASSLEETAASMEELTSTVKQNSENANQANQLALAASEVAIKGGNVVSEVVDTMSAINDSSKKIVDIISVIDGLAFQTNILALNAAVEAARAGEQGRGFAVVATEVRNLAQRSASAAKEIKELINNSVEKVGTGAKLVDQAGATMGEVVDSIRRVTDVMAEITAASVEQTQGIGQINEAVMTMDSVTQQNAALVEEAAAAAKSLQDQANNLTRVVGVFKLDSRQTSSSAMETSIINIAPAAMPERLASRAAGKISAPHKTASSVAAVKTTSTRHEAADDWEEF